MKVTLTGADVSAPTGAHVRASRAEVEAFIDTWPCCALPERPAWATFAVRTEADGSRSCGDLVDAWEGSADDDAAGLALVQDMEEAANKALARLAARRKTAPRAKQKARPGTT